MHLTHKAIIICPPSLSSPPSQVVFIWFNFFMPQWVVKSRKLPWSNSLWIEHASLSNLTVTGFAPINSCFSLSGKTSSFDQKSRVFQAPSTTIYNTHQGFGIIHQSHESSNWRNPRWKETKRESFKNCKSKADARAEMAKLNWTHFVSHHYSWFPIEDLFDTTRFIQNLQIGLSVLSKFR